MKIESIVSSLSSIIWGPALLIALLGTHIYFTLRLGFIQKHIFKAIRISFIRKAEGPGDISQFGSMVTALAATIGTGNIMGVSTAIAMGGPGAVFWMWLTGVFGIATKYAEALLAVKFRIKKQDGTFAGGPMYTLERGCNLKPAAILFAIFTAIAAFGIGNAVQSNSIAHLLEDTLGVNTLLTGTLLACLTGAVLIGGIRSISRICSVLVPFMAVAYIVGLSLILITNRGAIPSAIATILESAFTGHAAVGGFLGAGFKEAVRFGVARGLFSNESGLGSAPIIAAAARTKSAVRQALVSSTTTFWDTVVMCGITGVAFVASGVWVTGVSGAELAADAFSSVHGVGPIILSVCVFTFVFSTIIGWFYYGERAIEYLAGGRYLIYYKISWILFVIVGSSLSLNVVWGVADIANGLMAIPNLLSLFLLRRLVISESKEHLDEELRA